MKRLFFILFLFIFFISSGADVRQKIQKEKINLITVESIQQAKQLAQKIVDEDTEAITKTFGKTKIFQANSSMFSKFDVSKYGKTFTVLIPNNNQKKSINQFERAIQFSQKTVFMLGDVDLSNCKATTVYVEPDKDMVKKLIEQHNAKFQKPKDEKKDGKKSKSNNPFGVTNYGKD